MMAGKETRNAIWKLVFYILLAWIVFVVISQIVGFELRFFLTVLFLLSWIIPPVWVARDARKRGVENPLLWVVFVLLTWFVGFVVYLMLRPQEPLAFECNSCGREVKNEFAACPYCGQDLRPRIGRCPSCKRLIDREWSFCPYCKTQLPS